MQLKKGRYINQIMVLAHTALSSKKPSSLSITFLEAKKKMAFCLQSDMFT